KSPCRVRERRTTKDERRKTKRQGRPCRSQKSAPLLPAIYCLFQFCAWSELRHATSGNFNGCPCLRIAAVARLPLRNRKRPETNQGNGVAFLERVGDAFYPCIDCGRSLGLADPGSRRHPIN